MHTCLPMLLQCRRAITVTPYSRSLGASQRLPRICFGDLGDPVAVSTLQEARVDRVHGRPGCLGLFSSCKKLLKRNGVGEMVRWKVI